MKYVAKSYEDVYYSISLVDDEYETQDGELIIDNMRDAEAFPIPCKWDGEKWVYADVSEMGEISEDFDTSINYTPTKEERITALESAMLSMMEANANV